MKNFLNTNPLTFLMIVFIAFGFTSCEPETIIETEFVDRIVEVPGETIIVRDTVMVQTDYGNVSFVKMNNDTLQAGENIHLGKLIISDFVGFEIDNLEIRLRNNSFEAKDFLQESAIAVVSDNNSGSYYNNQNLRQTELEIHDGIIVDPVTEYDIYIQLDQFEQNTFVNYYIELELEKETTADTGNAQLDFEFDYNSGDFYNDFNIPAVGNANDEVVRLYVEDIDIDVDINANFSEGEITYELENDENATVLLNPNGLIFVIDGVEYPLATINQAGAYAASFDFSGSEDQNGNLILQGGDGEDLEITVTGPIGSNVVIKSIPMAIGNTSTNLTFDTEVNL